MPMNVGRFFSVLLSTFVALLMGGLLFTGWGLVGFVTGAIGICVTAPRWWSELYLRLFPVVLIGAILVGLVAGVWFGRRLSHGSSKG